MSSELEELTKLPGESILFDMDFTKRMSTGEVISTVVSQTSYNLGRVTASTNVTLGTTAFSGNVVQLRISDGTQDESYLIEIEITTSLGNTRIGKGLLRVE
jgi:hypothetical protein